MNTKRVRQYHQGPEYSAPGNKYSAPITIKLVNA
jgi:hypothetical protein